MTRVRQSSPVDLPFDILFELFGYCSGTDIMNLLSTCRTLHVHKKEEAVWKKLVFRYKLRDITNFGTKSFYQVYTQLLWPYGSLIGLWASDRYYLGNVVEFRLHPGSQKEPGGIVGDVWQFTGPRFGVHRPGRPSYKPLLKVTLEPQSSSQDTSVQACTICFPKSPEAAHLDPENALGTREHPVTIQVVPPSTFAHFLRSYRRSIPHPEFPDIDAAWYDKDRGRPHLQQTTSAAVDQRPLVSIYPAARLPIIFDAPTSHTKPTALSFVCGKDLCTALHQAPVPFDDIMTSPPRYYPMQYTVLSGIDPTSPKWTITSLEGLWLGNYGINGTELLYLSWHEAEQELRACKITGDLHVPRGATSWRVEAQGDVHELRSLLLDSWLQKHPATERLFCGLGTVSERGFQNPSEVQLIVGVTSPNELQIWWDKVNDMRVYTRYEGRNDLRS